MATRWYRAYVGTVNDPKIAGIAHSCGVPRCAVVAMWHFILERAAEENNGGKFKMDGHQICATLDLKMEDVKNIWQQMILVEMTTENTVLSWKKRQYETDTYDPTNIERQRRFRAKHQRNGTVTAVKRPDTDTDTDKIRDRGLTRKGVKTRIPDEWRPSSTSISDASSLGFTEAEVLRESQKFRNHAKQNERMVVRWDSAFDNWLIKAAEFANKTPPQAKIELYPAAPGSPEFQAWRTFWRDSKNPMLRELDQRELEGRPFKFEAKWPPGFQLGGSDAATH